MPRFNLLVLFAGLLGYLVSIIASTAMVLLFLRLNNRLLPRGGRVTALLVGETGGRSLAPAIALGAATLSQAYLLRHAVFMIMTLVQDFLVTYGNRLFTASFPAGPFFKLALLAAFLLIVLSVLSFVSIIVAGKFFTWMTPDMDELEQIAQGNVAIAVFFVFALFAVTVILDEGIAGVARALIPYSRSGVVRIQ